MGSIREQVRPRNWGHAKDTGRDVVCLGDKGQGHPRVQGTGEIGKALWGQGMGASKGRRVAGGYEKYIRDEGWGRSKDDDTLDQAAQPRLSARLQTPVCVPQYTPCFFLPLPRGTDRGVRTFSQQCQKPTSFLPAPFLGELKDATSQPHAWSNFKKQQQTALSLQHESWDELGERPRALISPTAPYD